MSHGKGVTGRASVFMMAQHRVPIVTVGAAARR
jgi:hypothetical protein